MNLEINFQDQFTQLPVWVDEAPMPIMEFIVLMQKYAAICAAQIDWFWTHRNWLKDEDHTCAAITSNQAGDWCADFIGLIAKVMPSQVFAALMANCYMASYSWQEQQSPYHKDTTLIRHGYRLVFPSLRTHTERINNEGCE